MNICAICGRIKNHSKIPIVSKKITIFARYCILLKNRDKNGNNINNLVVDNVSSYRKDTIDVEAVTKL